jgi:hypothetical protein
MSASCGGVRLECIPRDRRVFLLPDGMDCPFSLLSGKTAMVGSLNTELKVIIIIKIKIKIKIKQGILVNLART